MIGLARGAPAPAWRLLSRGAASDVAKKLVEALLMRGVEATVRQAADEADCILVELVDGSDGNKGKARIELRAGGTDSALVANSLEAIALLREVMMEQLIEL